MQASIFWDIENCSIPKKSTVSDAIFEFMHLSKKYNFSLDTINVVANSKNLSRNILSEIQRENILFEDTFFKKGNLSDIKLVYKILNTVLLNPPPYTIILITGDSDFINLLEILTERGYSTMLIYNALAPKSLIVKSAKSIKWTNLFKHDYTLYIDQAQTPENKPNTKPEKVYVGYVVQLHNSNVKNLYYFDQQLNVNDIVKVQDYPLDSNKWNVGKIVDIVHTNIMSPLLIYKKIDYVFFTEILKHKLMNDKQLLMFYQKQAKKILRDQVKIINVISRWDKFCIDVYYIQYTNVDLKKYISTITNGIIIKLHLVIK